MAQLAFAVRMRGGVIGSRSRCICLGRVREDGVSAADPMTLLSRSDAGRVESSMRDKRSKVRRGVFESQPVRCRASLGGVAIQ